VSGFFLASGDAAVYFESSEKILDAVAGPIKHFIIGLGRLRIFACRNSRLAAAAAQIDAVLPAVVTLSPQTAQSCNLEVSSRAAV
jgi:hypothetical protein